MHLKTHVFFYFPATLHSKTHENFFIHLKKHENFIYFPAMNRLKSTREFFLFSCNDAIKCNILLIDRNHLQYFLFSITEASRFIDLELVYILELLRCIKVKRVTLGL